jgi:hypothetical protein
MPRERKLAMTMGISPPWREQRLWIRPRDMPGNRSMTLWSLAAKKRYASVDGVGGVGGLRPRGGGVRDRGGCEGSSDGVRGAGADALRCRGGFRDLSMVTSCSAGRLLMARVMETWLTMGSATDADVG